MDCDRENSLVSEKNNKKIYRKIVSQEGKQRQLQLNLR